VGGGEGRGRKRVNGEWVGKPMEGGMGDTRRTGGRCGGDREGESDCVGRLRRACCGGSGWRWARWRCYGQEALLRGEEDAVGQWTYSSGDQGEGEC
jgi:hypothetical protein